MYDRLNSPVFVTGADRSGMMIISQVLNLCGGFSGFCNDKYENIQIKRLVDNYYTDLGLSPKGQYPLPETKKLFIPTNWKESILKIVQSEGYKGQVWMYQSPRITQLWPIWNYAFPDAKWIIVRRKPTDIINSCLRTGFMTAFASDAYQKEVDVLTESDGWKWWIHEHEKRFVEMIESGVNCKVLWPERMINGNYQQVLEMLDWNHLRWNEKVIPLVNRLLRLEGWHS